MINELALDKTWSPMEERYAPNINMRKWAVSEMVTQLLQHVPEGAAYEIVIPKKKLDMLGHWTQQVIIKWQ